MKQISKFLGLGEQEKNMIVKSMGKIQNRQAISNIKEFNLGMLFNIT